MAEKKKTKAEKLEELEKKHSFIISFSDVYRFPRHDRAKKAIAKLRKFAYKHFRIKPNAVAVSNALNEFIWQHGREHVPRKIAVKAFLAEGKLRYYLEDEKVEFPKPEKKVKEKPKEKEPTEEERKAEEEAKRRLEEKREKERAAEAAAIKLGTEK